MKTMLLKALEKYRKRTSLEFGPIQSALIDMDGTLYDSMPWHAKAWQKLMAELGVETNMEEFFAFEGMTGKATINLLFNRAFNREVSDEEADRLYARKSLYFRENNKARIMPGALRMVRYFQQNNVPTVLVTGSGQASLIERLNMDFNNAFPAERRITSRDVVECKPSPEPYLKALQLVQCPTEKAIVIENAPLGVMAGVAANIFTVAVNTGPIPKKALVDAGADLVFDSMREFADFLPQLL